MQQNTLPAPPKTDIDLVVRPVNECYDEEDELDEIDWILMGLRRQIKTQGSLKIVR